MTLFEPAFLDGGAHGEWNCSSGSIAVAVDVDDDALRPQTEPVRSSGNDSPVGLVRNEHVDIPGLQSIAFKNLLAQLDLLANCKFEYRLPVLVNIVHFLVDGLVSRGMKTSAAGHIQRAAAGAVDFVNEIDNAQRIIVGWFKNYRARAVAENYTGSAVGVI